MTDTGTAVTVAVYDTGGAFPGRIRWVNTCPPGMEAVQTGGDPDLSWKVVPSGFAQAGMFVADGVLTARPAMAFGKLAIAADDADEARLVLDRPFAAEIDGQVFQVSDPDEAGDYVLALTSPMPAAYRVRVLEWPYQDYETMVVAS